MDAPPGSAIRLRAILNAPASPAGPGAYFDAIGGSSFALGVPRQILLHATASEAADHLAPALNGSVVAADQTDQLALNLNLIGTKDAGLVGGVSRF